MGTFPKTITTYSMWPEHRALIWHAGQSIASKYLYDITWLNPVRPSETVSPEMWRRLAADIDPRPFGFYIEGFELEYDLERYNLFYRWLSRTANGGVQLSPGVDGVVQLTVWRQYGVFGIIEANVHGMMLGSNWQTDPDLRLERSALLQQQQAEQWGIPVWQYGLEGQLYFVVARGAREGRIISDHAAMKMNEETINRWKFQGMEQYFAAQKAARAQKSLYKLEARLAGSEQSS